MVLMNMKAAFDSVWHNALFYKLSTIGLDSVLVKIIRSFFYQTEHSKCILEIFVHRI